MEQASDILHTSALRQRLKDGKTCIGCWLGIADPLAVEAVAADVDVDWVQVDMEHAGLGWDDLKMILLGWKGCTTPLFVRAPSHDRTLLGRMLDLGVSGLIVPFVNTPEEAASLVAACRYPPQGTRGFAPRRVSNHYTQTEEYVTSANESVFVMVQIEHVRAVENVEAIAMQNLQNRILRVQVKAIARLTAQYILIEEQAKAIRKEFGDDAAELFRFFSANVREIVSQADTRSCRTLPAEIRVGRALVPPGTYEVRVVSPSGQQTRASSRLELRAGEKRFLILRSID